ncbi:MAG: hypothetical protein IKN04_10055 [Clostridia bacterium]|nr:hypothetical protein [Clostridia bacterium]
MKSITQNMRYLQSLMNYAQRYGVKAASRKYNRARSFIYFWRKRWDGSVESLQCQSRRPHAHPNQHTEEELKLIRNMRRRNPDLGIIELWCRLRERGYSRCVERLYRVMKREGLMPQKKKVKKYTPKPYEQMTHPGERIQIDVKVVPRKCIADSELRLYQYGLYGNLTHTALMATIADNDVGQQAMTETQPDSEQDQPVSGQNTIQVLIKSSGGKVNIRTGNGTSYSRLTAVAPGTTLDYVASSLNGWHAVKVGSQVGWVAGEFSEITTG